MVTSLADYRQWKMANVSAQFRRGGTRPRGAAANSHAVSLIESAGMMRGSLRNEEQRALALEAIENIGVPDRDENLMYLIVASDLAVDAMSCVNEHDAARQRAQATHEMTADFAPESVHAFAAERALTRALDLGGHSAEALDRLLRASFNLSTAPIASSARVTEQLLTLQSILRAAKWTGTKSAERVARSALIQGDSLADELQRLAPQLTAYYRQWAGFAESWLVNAGGSKTRAVELLQWSLRHRGRTHRDRVTAGMLSAEILLLQDERDGAVQLLHRTLSRFDDVLPHHAASTRRMLAMRKLDAAL